MWSHQRLFRQAMLHCSEPSAINLSVLQADWPTVIVIKVGGYQMVTSLAESIHVQMPDLPDKIHQAVHFVRAVCHQLTFENHTHDQKLYLTERLSLIHI